MARAVHVRARVGCAAALIGLAAIVLLAPIQTILWDGNFPSTEYRLMFVDGAGQPVPGVALRVETQAGGVSYFYPVDEFAPDHAPTSDADGRMVFHHTGHGIEFSGEERLNLLGMGFGGAQPPQYVCVFLVDGREVQRVRHDDLRARGNRHGRPRVTRARLHPNGPLREFLAHREEWSDYSARLFDANGDGMLDREELVARHYFKQAVSRAGEGHRERDVEFDVVERTITITGP